jgi:small subunit ribosomal protein S4
MITNDCKKCRRAGQKLFLKGERCFGQKCPMTRRPYPPGIHGKSLRRRVSEYGKQLIEKQKIRYSYGISEKQMKNYSAKIINRKGDKEELFINLLEKRLDNVVFRLGWSPSRKNARQLVSHGHILVNGRKTNIPSYQVKKGDMIKIKQQSLAKGPFSDLKTSLKKYQTPEWLSLDKEKMEGEIKSHPKKEDMEKISDISMIIEYYSR